VFCCESLMFIRNLKLGPCNGALLLTYRSISARSMLRVPSRDPATGLMVYLHEK
jgi:hypothetical protein